MKSNIKSKLNIKMIKLSFSLKIKLKIFLKAEREFLRCNSKDKLFHSFQALTTIRKTFHPLPRVYT